MTRLRPPKLHPNHTRGLYELQLEYRFVWGRQTYYIPETFHYDGASIPRFAWGLIASPFAPRVMTAALVHDWMYLTHLVDRATADRMFLYLLELSAVSRWKRWLMYRTLRWVGGLAWKMSDRDKIRLQQLETRLKRKRLPLSRYRLGSQEKEEP